MAPIRAPFFDEKVLLLDLMRLHQKAEVTLQYN